MNFLMTPPRLAQQSGASGRWERLAFYGLAAVSILAALFLRFSLIERHLPAKASAYLGDLSSGIQILRLALAGAAVLAVATPWILQRFPSARIRPVLPPLDRWDWGALLVLFCISVALRSVRLSDSFWWDELTTYLRTVRRGLPVVFAFSSEGNNHPLNSFLMWIVYAAGGRSEWMLRLPALLLGGLTPAVIYCLLRRYTGRLAALLAGAVMALHFRSIAHSAEARGYAGAMLFSTIAILVFPLLFEEGAEKLAVVYVLAAAAAAGFIATALILPLAHGAVAAAAWALDRYRGRPARGNPLLPLLSCAWAFVVSLLLMGVTLPQLRTYSTQGALTAHKTLSLELLLTIAQYAAGVSGAALALLLIAVALLGLWRMEIPLLAAAAFFPATLYVLVVGATGGRVSPRLFYLMIFPFSLGLGWFLYRLFTTRGPVLRVAACAVCIAWLAGAAGDLARFYSLGNPPLRQLGAQLSGQDIVITGLQSDVNSYYFPKAREIQPEDLTWAALNTGHPPEVVAGISCARTTFQPMAALGYHLSERYNDALDRICYLLYTPPQSSGGR